MNKYIKLDLVIDKDKNKKLYYNDSYLNSYKGDLDNFFDRQVNMNNIGFAKKVMMGHEIKANNDIEGLVDGLDYIDSVINNNISNGDDRKRIINLYKGYKYILKNKDINKDSLCELYSILSDDLLCDRDRNNMGEYYREGPVYIYHENRLDVAPIECMPYSELDYYMNCFFDYVNSSDNNNEINNYIKSQIMHYYFVYIHPYFDVNGRTSRTVSMWYLLNNNNYPYIIFNRAISFAKNNYDNVINKCRNRGEVTLFIEYMLIQVLKELEKEYLISNINNNSGFNLDIDEEQMIEYFINMNGNLTVKDLARFYNSHNFKMSPRKLFDDKIEPLISKKIFLVDGYTKSYIYDDVPNMWIKLNNNNIDVDKKKFKYLRLDKYV